MSDPHDDRYRRSEVREQTRRDVQRHRRRDPSGGFWRSVALVGSVGWPIVLLATGGGLLGRFIDARYGTGVRFTLMLIAIGATAGTWIAFRTSRGR